jgi:hypothetical protein
VEGLDAGLPRCAVERLQKLRRDQTKNRVECLIYVVWDSMNSENSESPETKDVDCESIEVAG